MSHVPQGMAWRLLPGDCVCVSCSVHACQQVVRIALEFAAGAALGGAKEAHDAILDMLNLRGKGPSITYQAQNSSSASENQEPVGDKEL